MTDEQQKLIKIGKKESVIRFNSNKEPFEVLSMSKDIYLALPIDERLSKVEKIVIENKWKGQRKTADQKEKEKKQIDFENNFEILKDILIDGTKEEKDILFGVIRDHKKVLQIKELEKELAKQEKDIEAKKAKLKELKGE